MGLADPFVFISQTFKDFRTTGAIAPSSPFLARAMAGALPHADKVPENFRVLEVGAGTGAFSKALAKRLRHRGQLDLYEISKSFAAHLRKRLGKEDAFRQLDTRVKLHEGDVRALPKEPTFDCIVSGLPLNNFTGAEVRGFLELFKQLLKPGGTLTYFEYVAIRRVKSFIVGKAERERLRAVGAVVDEFIHQYQTHQAIVPINIPPARVRHLCFEAAK
jgi:phospholipid N-methyltransferase